MFYSETLLSKTGPLARVWLSANLERKLSKAHILQSNIESSVSAIVDRQAPMALRLSGQLLLGVVRIYSRKARYLLDDCNEALLKIKMAFRPGNVDLPANANMPNAAALTLPDVLTELDLLPPMPDESLLMTQPMDLDFGANDNDPLNWTSQGFSDPISIEQGRNEPEERPDFDDDLDLQLDIDLDDGPSIERGRDAPPPRLMEDDLITDDKFHGADDLDLDIGLDDPTRARFSTEAPSVRGDDYPPLGDEDDNMMGNGDDLVFPMEDTTAPIVAPTDDRLQRDSQSPLSSVRSSVVRELDNAIFEQEEEPSLHGPSRPKKRKLIQPDADTVIHSSQIKQQQVDRSAILKPLSFLPRDPMLLTLMQMQQNGGFVSSIMGDGRAKGWAPELRGILSIEVVRKSGELKRKRDSGVADVDEEEARAGFGKVPQLEIPEDEDFGLADEGVAFGGDNGLHNASEVRDLPADEGLRLQTEEEVLPANGNRQGSEDDDMSPLEDNFDDTTAPLIHPVDSGPVSIGTRHAVHLLRDRFGSAAEDSPSQQKKANVLFQELLPEATTTKADATKMFFEVLVLATKDAVKVEQGERELGGPLRIRGKRGLWGAWAEREAGGEIAEQATQATVAAA
ncbi:MAG: double-strand-break repair rad21 [Lasallia pustulata]|uniref:Double-strand-break repair rad21 n=1 Tax=Lasallia pustulata TaxID=136370 RepID=A0A5M8PVK0_9LECA|nr:MAG: double-strand-break repair rad21 [Lasallia pustulata]